MLNKALVLIVTTITICSTYSATDSSLADAQINSSSLEQPKKVEQSRTRGSGSLEDYTSSDKPKNIEQRRTVGSGSRSFCQSPLPENSITLLIPESEVVHKTSVSRPFFFLHSNIALKDQLKFTLVNPQVPKPIVENTFLMSKPGIKKIELPKSVNLESGTLYFWYVAIPCDGSRNEQYQEILRSSVEFVPVSTKVQVDLESAKTAEETAAIYSKNGFWYEALKYFIDSNPDYLRGFLSDINSE